MNTAVVKPVSGKYFGYAYTDFKADVFFNAALRYAQRLSNKRTPPEQLHIVIFGGAFGYEAARFAKQGHRVTMFDIGDYSDSVRDINQALGRDLVTFVEADIRKIKFQDYPKADLIFCSNLLHFMNAPDAILALVAISGFLKPKARCFLRFNGSRQITPAPFLDLQERVAAAALTTKIKGALVNVQQYPYSFAEIQILLAQANLRISKYNSYLVPHRIIASIAAGKEIKPTRELAALYPCASNKSNLTHA